MSTTTRLILATALICCGILAETFQILGAPDDAPDPEPGAGQDSVARGKVVHERFCKACHSVDGTKGVGATFDKMWGTSVKLAVGDPVDYDEDFFRESLTNPSTKITKGYANQMTPFQLSEPQTEDLIDYVKSLGDAQKVAESEARMEARRAEWLAKLEPPAVNVKRVHLFCNDVKAMRGFYSTTLQLQEIEYKDNAERGWLIYRTAGFELMFIRWKSPLPVEEQWGWLPGAPVADDSPLFSLSLRYEEKQYRQVVKQADVLARAYDFATRTNRPVWRAEGHWGWTLRDPMGNTVELLCTPAAEPDPATPPQWKD